MEDVKKYPLKVLVFKMFTEGLTLEQIMNETGQPIKVVNIWIAEFSEMKQQRLNDLLFILQNDTLNDYRTFTVWERIFINQERANLLSDFTKFDVLLVEKKIGIRFYNYPEPLSKLINQEITKTKQCEM